MKNSPADESSISLSEMLRRVQNGPSPERQAAVLAMLNRFAPLLKKYAGMLREEDTLADLQTDFIAVIKRLDPEGFKTRPEFTEYAILSYIRKAIYSSYLKRSKTRGRNREVPVCGPEIIATSPSRDTFGTEPLSPDIIDRLTPREKAVIQNIIIAGRSTAETARRLGISRQAVNQTKQRALNKLRKLSE